MGDSEPILYVSEKDQSRLYLIFASEDVSDLAFYFGIVPLSLALVLIYGLSFLTYRLSHRAISPIVQLADYLEQFPFEKASHSTKDLQQLRSLLFPLGERGDRARRLDRCLDVGRVGDLPPTRMSPQSCIRREGA